MDSNLLFCGTTCTWSKYEIHFVSFLFLVLFFLSFPATCMFTVCFDADAVVGMDRYRSLALIKLQKEDIFLQVHAKQLFAGSGHR